LLWLQQNEPEVFKRAAKFLDVNGYLIYRCTGQMVIDWSAASVIGLFDLKRKRWMTTLAHCLGLPIEKLPTLLRSTEIVGGLKSEAAKALGLLTGTPVVCGAGDVLTAAVGAGTMDNGEGHIYLGTSGWVGVITGKSSIGKHGLATIQSAQADKCLLIAETEAAGACWQWLAETMFREEQRHMIEHAFQAINEAIERIEPGAKQLLFTPWLYGERAPVADVFVRSAFVNLCPYHTREHLARAVSEGIAYNLRWIIEIIRDDFNFDLNTFRICGGGAQSDAWLQIIADVTGKCIERVAPVREVGAVGAALIASVALGLYPDLKTLKTAIKVERVFQPHRTHVQVYDHLFAIYKRLYFALKPIYRSMNLKHPAAG
jgi:xylulokinase